MYLPSLGFLTSAVNLILSTPALCWGSRRCKNVWCGICVLPAGAGPWLVPDCAAPVASPAGREPPEDGAGSSRPPPCSVPSTQPSAGLGLLTLPAHTAPTGQDACPGCRRHDLQSSHRTTRWGEVWRSRVAGTALKERIQKWMTETYFRFMLHVLVSVA